MRKFIKFLERRVDVDEVLSYTLKGKDFKWESEATEDMPVGRWSVLIFFKKDINPGKNFIEMRFDNREEADKVMKALDEELKPKTLFEVAERKKFREVTGGREL